MNLLQLNAVADAYRCLLIVMMQIIAVVMIVLISIAFKICCF